MGILYVIRHGQRFPLKIFPQFKSTFGEEPVIPGELTELGRTRMQQLGATFKEVPIVKAKFSDVKRCEESLTEFLKGAECSVRAEQLGDQNFVSFEQFAQNCDVTELSKAINSFVRNRETLDRLIEKYLPGLEAGFIRDSACAAFLDAMGILDDRGAKEMTADLKEVELDIALGVTFGMRSFFGEAMRKAILDAFEENGGHTVALVSDMHLLYVLQRVAPLFIDTRPPFGAVLKITPSRENVLLEYQGKEAEIPLAEFRRRMDSEVPSSHF